MYCKYCGERNDVNTRTCSSCQKALQQRPVAAKVAPQKKNRFFVIGALIVAVILVGAFIAVFSSNRLSGTYESTCGRFTIEFVNSRELTWQQPSGTILRGSHQQRDNQFMLSVQGSGLYMTTNFVAVRDGDYLVVSGGTLRNVRFERQ